MANVEQQRKQREAEAYRREEQHRAERRVIEQAARDREKRELERRRYDQMAKGIQEAKRAAEMAAMDKKQELWMKDLEQKKEADDRALLDQQAQFHKSAREGGLPTKPED